GPPGRSGHSVEDVMARRLSYFAAWLAVVGLVACARGAGSASPASAPAGSSPGDQAAGQAAAAPRPVERITMTYPSAGMCCLPIFAARDRGFFARNGLEAETVLMTSDRAMAAVASGE